MKGLTIIATTFLLLLVSNLMIWNYLQYDNNEKRANAFRKANFLPPECVWSNYSPVDYAGAIGSPSQGDWDAYQANYVEYDCADLLNEGRI